MNGVDTAAPARRGILARLGLRTREQRAWAMYDWAASAFQTTIMVAVFPIYFIKVAGAGQPIVAGQWWGFANAAAIATVALLSPVLGAVADFSAAKKRFLGGSPGWASPRWRGCTSSSAATWGWPAPVLRRVAGGLGQLRVLRVAAAAHRARGGGGPGVHGGVRAGVRGRRYPAGDEPGLDPEPDLFGIPAGTLPARLSFLSVALWWLLFSLPLLRRVPEPPRAIEADEAPTGSAVRTAFARLGETFRELRGYRNAFLFLLAFLLYNDGIATIQKMAAPYATELGIDEGVVIGSILLVQFVGIPFAFLFGALAGGWGPSGPSCWGCWCTWGSASSASSSSDGREFLLLALMVGMVQGGTQALSRSLFSTLIPPHKSGEFFGFFSVFSKFAGIFGPLLFAAIIGRYGSSRYGILSVIAFFFVGGVLLMFVDVDEGQRVARDAEDAVRRLDEPKPSGAAV